MGKRKEFARRNREMLSRTLEHVQNNTNIGLKLSEGKNSFIVSLPDETMGVEDLTDHRNFIISGAQLIFTQDPDDGLKVRHKLPQVRNQGQYLKSETVNIIPAPSLTVECIYKQVIDFLEKVKQL